MDWKDFCRGSPDLADSLLDERVDGRVLLTSPPLADGHHVEPAMKVWIIYKCKYLSYICLTLSVLHLSSEEITELLMILLQT